jgi:dolichyl-diphosphooligosaccharide--protein glycosyltransferase
MGARQVELAASVVPPLIGALTVLAVYRLTRRWLGPAEATLSGLILCLLPGQFWYSQVGYVDHHCAVALVAVLLLHAGMRVLANADAPAGPPRAGALAAWLKLGALFALALLVWPGTLIHVGVVEAGLIAFGLVRAEGERAADFARGLAVAHALALILVLPFCFGNVWPQWSAMSPVVLSDFQPWLFLTAAVGFGVCDRLWRARPQLASGAGARLASASAIGGVLLAASLLAWPALLEGLGDAWAWLARTESFQSLVGESRPLLILRGAVSLVPAVSNLSGFVVLLPIAIALLFARARRLPSPSAIRLLAGWSLAFAGLALAQRRFVDTAAPVVAILFAWSLVQAYAWLLRDDPSQRRKRVVAAGCSAVAALLLWPALVFYTPIAESLAQGRGRVALVQPQLDAYAAYDTARWLRENTPPTSGWIDSAKGPEYSIVGPWTLGHVIQYVGRRPTATNNFGDDIGARNFGLVQDYFAAEETQAARILDQLGGRYVVVPYYESFLRDPPGERSMYRALWSRDGSAGMPDAPAAPALSRHRLVWEFRRGGRARMKIFEFVRGAQISGEAPAGSAISLRLAIDTSGDRQLEYVARTLANDRGRYSFRVPYASAVTAGAVQTATFYLMSCDAGEKRMQVTEAEVRRGRRVAGPAMCEREEEAGSQ